MKFSSDEAKRVQTYLQMKFANQKITVGAFSKAGDSAEILLDGEFMGTLYKDTEDGETSYDFNMAILDIDLPPAA
ncbi:MAG: DUF3126 family protein [Alphaproteobacteria bacterium]|nr:DUF3126 family protein [Alphaproteobacteria bacterium]